MVYIKFIYIGKCYNRPFNSASIAYVWYVDAGGIADGNLAYGKKVHSTINLKSTVTVSKGTVTSSDLYVIEPVYLGDRHLFFVHKESTFIMYKK